MIKFPEVPKGSVLGVNYSGMHDSSIAIVDPSGKPIFAISLERISRVKQDSCPPFVLLKGLPWDCLSKVAVSTEAQFVEPDNSVSVTHPTQLPQVRNKPLIHHEEFYQFIDSIPCDKEFVCHQLSHASSAFWGSGFDEALCLTYDGGMSNTAWFGGFYGCSKKNGISPLDRFSAMHYAKITSLYTVVTALLGFTPNKHEGKITGLAAFGVPSARCRKLLARWFEYDFYKIESVLRWVFSYSDTVSAQLIANEPHFEELSMEVVGIPKEELAATLQEMTEKHILELLSKAKELGWSNKNICLAGGLFANVKLNQRIAEFGFDQLFVAPPMTDDGTALGAAWHVLSKEKGFNPNVLHSMYLGSSYDKQDIAASLACLKVQYEHLEAPAVKIADLLARGKVVAVYQGAMELGPRSLGNRSILAPANKSDINDSLNDRLNRTEFMPFAPITRVEDAALCYEKVDRIQHAAEFMTVTVDCTDEMKRRCPAVVHVDGTARPQLVTKDINFLIHDILTHYSKLTGNYALVNTSFNIHEEPIVCSPEDALQGFFVAGLDYLYLEGGYLIAFSENKSVALKLLQGRLRKPSQKNEFQSELIALKDQEKIVLEQNTIELQSQVEDKDARMTELQSQVEDKDARMTELQSQVEDKDARMTELQSQVEDKDVRIELLFDELVAKEKWIRNHRHCMPAMHWCKNVIGRVRVVNRIKGLLTPKLGQLFQYPPRDLVFSDYDCSLKKGLSDWPSISIVTPSFGQGHFIERTMKSVLEQEYPNLEYFVQDGGSKDETVQILKRYEDQLDGWVSEPDSGQSQAINRGMQKTTGEIMAWLNSDDLLLPGTLAYVAAYFAQHPEVDVVYGHRVIIDGNDMEIGKWMMPEHDDEVLTWGDYIPQETLFWRRSIWEKAGGNIDEEFRFAMDWDLLLRFRDAGAKFKRLPIFAGAFRVHSEQKTSANIHDVGMQEMDVLRQRVLGRSPAHAEIRKGLLMLMIKHTITHLDFMIRKKVGWSRKLERS